MTANAAPNVAAAPKSAITEPARNNQHPDTALHQAVLSLIAVLRLPRYPVLRGVQMR